MINIAIMASGEGTIAESLYLESLNHDFFQVKSIICDQPKAGIIKRFQKYNFPITVIKKSSDKKTHEKEIIDKLTTHQCQWIFLAGYMRILSSFFIERFSSEGKTRIVNIHPALLPKYPGLNSYEKAYEAGDKIAGLTVHYVDTGVDTGPIIEQATFERSGLNTLEEFIQKGKNLEKEQYPKILVNLLKESLL